MTNNTETTTETPAVARSVEYMPEVIYERLTTFATRARRIAASARDHDESLGVLLARIGELHEDLGLCLTLRHHELASATAALSERPSE